MDHSDRPLYASATANGKQKEEVVGVINEETTVESVETTTQPVNSEIIEKVETEAVATPTDDVYNMNQITLEEGPVT